MPETAATTARMNFLAFWMNWRGARGFAAVAYGVNADDTSDFRPGHRAAAEHRVLAPLLEAKMSKADIRALSQRAGLPTWDRPASACLSSRLPYGTEVTPERLTLVENGEAILRALGFRQFRVRLHDKLARIEIAREELPLAMTPGNGRDDFPAVQSGGFSLCGAGFGRLPAGVAECGVAGAVGRAPVKSWEHRDCSVRIIN